MSGSSDGEERNDRPILTTGHELASPDPEDVRRFLFAVGAQERGYSSGRERAYRHSENQRRRGVSDPSGADRNSSRNANEDPWQRGKSELAPKDAEGDVNHWTPELEHMADRLVDRTAQEAWIYSRMAVHAKKWSNILAIISGVLTGIIGVEGLFSLLEECGDGLGIRITMTVLSFLALITLTIFGVWAPDEAVSDALRAEVKLLGIQRSVSLQLALKSTRRQKGEKFMRAVLADHEAALLAAPTPFDSIIRQAEKRYGSRFAACGAYHARDVPLSHMSFAYSSRTSSLPRRRYIEPHRIMMQERGEGRQNFAAEASLSTVRHRTAGHELRRELVVALSPHKAGDRAPPTNYLSDLQIASALCGISEARCLSEAKGETG